MEMIMTTKVITEYLGNFLRLFGRDAKTGAEHCLSDTDIANLIDDKVRKRERKRFLQHLNQCAHCYHLWTETAAFVKSFEAESEISAVNEVSRVQQFFHAWLFSPIKWASAAGAGAAAVLLVMLWSGPGSYPDNIDVAYAQLAFRDQHQIEELARELSTHTQSNTMAFSQSTANASRKAFAAGLENGVQGILHKDFDTVSLKQTTSTDSDLTQSGLDVYFQFGRWTALAWISAQLHNTDVEWNSLQEILAELQKQFAQEAETGKESAVAIAEIQRLRPLLEQTATANATARKALVQALSMTIAKLTPS